MKAHPSQRDVLIFLLQHGHDSTKYIRLQALVDKAGYSKSTTYKAIDALHRRGWIRFYKSSQVNASWLGYNDGLPGEFLRELRSSLAQARGFPSWCDFIMRNEGAHRPSERTTGKPPTMWQTKEIAATKTPCRYDGSDGHGIRKYCSQNQVNQVKSLRPQQEPGRHNANLNFTSDQVCRKTAQQKRHRFDPQGFPLRAATHDTRK